MNTNFGITETTMGFVFAINSLSEFIASLGLDQLLKKRFLSRRTLLLIGCLF
jgi:predicted MFS family arabinose efflux permease